MEPRLVTRQTALRMLLGSGLGALLLPACTEWAGSSSESTSASKLSGEWVDAKALFKSPKNFADRGRLRFYLTQVAGEQRPAPNAPEHLWILSGDSRQDPLSFALSLMLTPAAKKRWEDAELAKGFEYQYGVTFSGHVMALDHSDLDWYAFLADSFDINDETSYLQSLDQRKLHVEYMPTQVLELPRPITIEDSKRVSLLAKDYIGRKVRFDLTFREANLKVSRTGEAYIVTDDLSLTLNETVVRGLVDQREALTRSHVIGKVLKERDEGGRVKIEVLSMEKRSW